MVVLVVLVGFNYTPSPVQAEAGTLDLKASTASYSGSFTQAGNQPIRTAFGPLRLDYKSGPNDWTTGLLMREGDGNITVGAGITSADFYSTSKLRVLGIIESTTGGFKFPDGTTQTSAVSGAAAGGWTDGGTSIYNTTLTDNVGIGTTSPGTKLQVAGNIDSSTGALQTAGVTRISNTGVGTLAAGTTIGGSAVTAAVVDKTLASGRLTLTSGTPVTTTDVTAATTVYYTPYNGDVISLYDGTSTWTTLTFSELSLALTNYTANKNYDIFAYNNSGTVALESLVWTNDTTRATAIVQQNGVWVKSGATTRRLLGTIRITGTTGQTEDSMTKRYISNVV